VLGVQVEVEVGALLGLDLVERVLEEVAVDVEHGLAEHLDEPPVGVPGEPLAARLLGEALHRLVVEPDVEDGLHHPGHGRGGTRADRDQERVGGVAERLAHRLLQRHQVLADLLVELGRGAAVLQVVPAGVGGDGETGRDRQPEVGHLRQVGALAAEQVLLVLVALAEVVDPLRGRLAGHRDTSALVFPRPGAFPCKDDAASTRRPKRPIDDVPLIVAEEVGRREPWAG
jgi:hypothetical protein